MTETDSPFAVLGVAATLDTNVIKKAWFVALQKHPPHSDPLGFRKVRDAYEALTRPGGIEVAYATAPVDIDAELGALGVRLDAGLARARSAAQRAAAVEVATRRFVDTYSRLGLREAKARLKDGGASC